MPGAALVGDVVVVAPLAGARLVRHHEAGEGGAHVGGAVVRRAGGEAGGRAASEVGPTMGLSKGS